MDIQAFFNGWQGLARTAVIGVCAYFALLILLRVSGKRTLSKMNAFDLVVTVALGSTLATILLSKNVPLAEGVLALGLLIFLQYAITWMSVRFPIVSRMVKAEPRLLYHRGEFLERAMKSERINRDEVLQAMRNQGIGGHEQVESVVMETDGSISVVKKTEADPTALKDISNPSAIS